MSKKNKDEKIKKDEKDKNDVPVLKNPSKSTTGKIVIWVLLSVMAITGVISLIIALIKWV